MDHSHYRPSPECYLLQQLVQPRPLGPEGFPRRGSVGQGTPTSLDQPHQLSTGNSIVTVTDRMPLHGVSLPGGCNKQ